MVTMFHGTDLRIIKMSSEERELLTRLSWAIIGELRDYFPKDPARVFYLQKFYSNELWGKPLSNEDKLLMINNLGFALSRIDLQRNECPLFQYGSFYLTISRFKAANYARDSFAFGELGLTAFRLLESAISLGIKKIGPFEIKEYSSKLLNLALGNPQPVISIINCDELLLKSENGSDISFSEGKPIYDCFRYEGKVDLSDPNVKKIPLKEWKVFE